MATYKYGRASRFWITTDALKKYRDENGLSTQQLAEKIGDNLTTVSLWLTRKRAPRAVLEKLGITVRGPYKQRADKKTVSSIPAGGTIYACYVGAAEKTAFLAFCAAMHISAKDMI